MILPPSVSIDGVEVAIFELNALFLPLMKGCDWLKAFECEAVDKGLVNFNHHFTKKLQLKLKDLYFFMNLGVETLECKWF